MRKLAVAAMLVGLACGGAWAQSEPPVADQAPRAVRADAMALERWLSALGYDVGAVDGRVDAETRGATAAFQAEIQLPSTGEASAKTLSEAERFARLLDQPGPLFGVMEYAPGMSPTVGVGQTKDLYRHAPARMLYADGRHLAASLMLTPPRFEASTSDQIAVYRRKLERFVSWTAADLDGGGPLREALARIHLLELAAQMRLRYQTAAKDASGAEIDLDALARAAAERLSEALAADQGPKTRRAIADRAAGFALDYGRMRGCGESKSAREPLSAAQAETMEIAVRAYLRAGQDQALKAGLLHRLAVCAPDAPRREALLAERGDLLSGASTPATKAKAAKERADAAYAAGDRAAARAAYAEAVAALEDDPEALSEILGAKSWAPMVELGLKAPAARAAAATIDAILPKGADAKQLANVAIQDLKSRRLDLERAGLGEVAEELYRRLAASYEVTVERVRLDTLSLAWAEKDLDLSFAIIARGLEIARGAGAEPDRAALLFRKTEIALEAGAFAQAESAARELRRLAAAAAPNAVDLARLEAVEKTVAERLDSARPGRVADPLTVFDANLARHCAGPAAATDAVETFDLAGYLDVLEIQAAAVASPRAPRLIECVLTDKAVPPNALRYENFRETAAEAACLVAADLGRVEDARAFIRRQAEEGAHPSAALACLKGLKSASFPPAEAELRLVKEAFRRFANDALEQAAADAPRAIGALATAVEGLYLLGDDPITETGIARLRAYVDSQEARFKSSDPCVFVEICRVFTLRAAREGSSDLRALQERLALKFGLLYTGTGSDARSFEMIRRLGLEEAERAMRLGQRPVAAAFLTLDDGPKADAKAALHDPIALRYRIVEARLDLAEGRGEAAAARLEPLIQAIAGAAGARGAFSSDAFVAEARRLSASVDLYLRVATDAALKSGEPVPLSPAVFTALQFAQASETAATVGKLAARMAAKDGANLVRAHQDNDRKLRAAYAKLGAFKGAKAALAEVERLERDQARLSAEIAERAPGYFQHGRLQVASLSGVQARLAPDAAALIASERDDRLIVAFVSNATAKLVAHPLDPASVRGLVAELRAGLELSAGTGAPMAAYDLTRAHEAYRRLLGWTGPAADDVRRLILAFDGALAALPFAALPVEPAPIDLLPATGEGADKIAWAGLRFTIAAAPSLAQAGLAPRPPSPSARPYLGFGDPKFADGPLPDLAALPETALEVQALAGTLKADGARDLRLGAEAAEAELFRVDAAGALKRYEVVSFATHALLAEETGEIGEPALVLSAGDGRDGVLTVSEILDLRLDADLVLLSACNTAAGDGPDASGLSGLARAFSYAGARSLIVTHWRIESVAAVQMAVNAFDAHAKAPEQGWPEALRAAMRWMATESPQPEKRHPGFWAAHMVVGASAAALKPVEPASKPAAAAPRKTTAVAAPKAPERAAPAPAAAPELRAPDPRSDPALARALQIELKRLKYYQSAIDGAWGRGSAGALAAYARDRKIRVDPEAYEELLVRLKAEPTPQPTPTPTPTPRPKADGAVGAAPPAPRARSGAGLVKSDFNHVAGMLQQVAERSPSGRPVGWRNPATGASGTLTANRAFRSPQGLPCRPMNLYGVSRANIVTTARFVACRGRDGLWRVAKK